MPGAAIDRDVAVAGFSSVVTAGDASRRALRGRHDPTRSSADVDARQPVGPGGAARRDVAADSAAIRAAAACRRVPAKRAAAHRGAQMRSAARAGLLEIVADQHASRRRRRAPRRPPRRHRSARRTRRASGRSSLHDHAGESRGRRRRSAPRMAGDSVAGARGRGRDRGRARSSAIGQAGGDGGAEGDQLDDHELGRAQRVTIGRSGASRARRAVPGELFAARDDAAGQRGRAANARPRARSTAAGSTPKARSPMTTDWRARVDVEHRREVDVDADAGQLAAHRRADRTGGLGARASDLGRRGNCGERRAEARAPGRPRDRWPPAVATAGVQRRDQRAQLPTSSTLRANSTTPLGPQLFEARRVACVEARPGDADGQQITGQIAHASCLAITLRALSRSRREHAAGGTTRSTLHAGCGTRTRVQPGSARREQGAVHRRRGPDRRRQDDAWPACSPRSGRRALSWSRSTTTRSCAVSTTIRTSTPSRRRCSSC